MKAIIELTPKELDTVLKNGALETFVEKVSWEIEKTAEIGSGKKEKVKEEVKEDVKEEEEKTQAPQSAPTAEIAYKLEDLQKCAAELARADKREELSTALQSFGINSILELKPEMYNDFAQKLRDLGGVL